MLFFGVALGVSAGCTEVDPPMSIDTDVSVEADTGQSDADVPSVGDAGSDSGGEPDSGTPPLPDTTPGCGVCCPGEVSCVSETRRAICAEDGSRFDELDCGEGESCNEGQCISIGICEPGDKRCHDGSTLLVCRTTGEGWSPQACGAGSVCIGGECVSGSPNGATCSVDGSCAGGACRCGSDDSCPASYRPAYCTNACDSQGDCTTDEWCLDASQYHAPHAYDHCVRRCDQACAISGLACKYVPVHDGGEQRWEQACVQPNLKSVGEECTSHDECLAGFCNQDIFSTTGYCTRRCETGSCPANSACVELRTGEYWCSLLCDGQECPLNVPEQRFDVTCKVRGVLGGGIARVCASTS